MIVHGLHDRAGFCRVNPANIRAGVPRIHRHRMHVESPIVPLTDSMPARVSRYGPQIRGLCDYVALRRSGGSAGVLLLVDVSRPGT